MAEVRASQSPGMPRWARESVGVAAAVAIGIGVVAAVASTPRGFLLFHDADSLVTTLVVHSIASGQPQDWALSTVLFLPETAMLGLLTLFGLGIEGTLALAGVVNFVVLYAALRVAAGRAGRGRMPILGALLALGAYALLAASESSPSREALELASLLTTTTYYSATVVGVVFAIGIARRGLDRADVSRGTAGESRLRPGSGARDIAGLATWGAVAVIAVVAAASVLSNPLFAVWATVPLAIVLCFAGVSEPAGLWLAGGLVAGSVVGFAGRMPLSRLIANTGASYADPSQWPAALQYYTALLVERLGGPWGAASVIALVLLWGWCVVATVLLARRREVGAAVVAACGWVMPLVVVVGAIAVGTHAARYLQPAVFAPLLGLVALPELLPRRVSTARPALAIGATALALATAVGIGIPRIATTANAPDPDLACVVRWVEQSGRTGAGQFWTVRLPKTHLADPRRLVQVDHQLRGYAWLVDRDDFTVGEVSFLVLDPQSAEYELPEGWTMADAELTSCGRYTIADFGAHPLPLGTQRS